MNKDISSKDGKLDVVLLIAYLASGFAVMRVIKNFRQKKDI